MGASVSSMINELEEIAEEEVYYRIFSGAKMVVFDVAGTIINEKGIVYKTLQNTLEKYKIPYTNEEFDKCHGISKSTVLEKFLQKSDVEVKLEDLVNDFYRQLQLNYDDCDNIELFDGVVELFQKLKSKNIYVCLDTGYSEDMTKKIFEKLDLEQYIDGYVTSDMVSIGRPFPYMIYRLMEEFKIDSPDYVVKVGDTISDILEGINAGVKYTVGVLSGADSEIKLKRINPDLIVDSVKDLINDKYY